MNYAKIYACIVLRSQIEHDERMQMKHDGVYFEIHHIIPKSLGGDNSKGNLVVLTAREHFICHWLLVKMYPAGSSERGKMLNALWRMRRSPRRCKGQRYVNARAYEFLRSEFSVRQKEVIDQRGCKNSRYGTKWFASMYTGESRAFRTEPISAEWVPGRNVFNGQSSSIRQLLRHQRMLHKIDERNRQKEEQRKNNMNKPHKLTPAQIEAHAKAIEAARAIWDEFHRGCYSKLEDYSNEIGISKMALSNKFKKYIPKYSMHGQGKLFRCKSNRDLIGIYE